MPPILGSYKPRIVIKSLRRAGFVIHHQTGSHAILYKAGHPNPITVPIHNRDLKRGTLLAILNQANLSKEQFLELLKK